MLKTSFPDLSGRATTYQGALTALRGRHAFWPYTKYNYVMDGLKMMDEGMAMVPDDIEALFIHGSTCHFIPFFFGRSDEAQADFKNIIRLLPKHMHQYDPEIVKNVISFLLEHTKLSDAERDQLSGLLERVAADAG